ncbi:thioredoxin family protein [Clostridium formicaceticum]|uniref:Redox-active disulfide protein 2 n=1 Tax=Clostridium formicaceticum TaxID=1497 RepID=A0AAC9RJL9_9CLOT|nr:thioredoxin family protein [Clostridium formicaceticum]AOY76125.1 redox-active disulfide protein 2 [Clostridium formicaceticum]ARE86493.1 hypothetical protein CLFO_08150 [Clostridium formicaceticum]
MTIKILGSGCKNCIKLEENVKAAVKELGLQASVEKVTDMELILGYGVMRTPGLVLNEKAVSAGKVLSVEDIKKILSN